MDRSKPLRRLLPVGVLSAAGLAGCASTPAYRPVMTSPTPPNPVVVSPSVTAPGPVGAAPIAPLSAPVSPGAAPNAEPIVAPPALPAPPQAVDAPLVPPPPPTVMPAPPVSETAPPSSPAGAAPGAAVTEPLLSAPMGVLQTPLPSPPVVVQPSEPARLTAPGPAESIAPSVPAATDATPAPATKKAATKPADPPLSPLARLRKKFHSLTHPAPKPTKKDTDALAAGDAKAGVTVASGPRVPIPTASVGVAVRVEKPPFHPLYASDEVESLPPIASSTQTAQVDATVQPIQPLPLVPPAPPAVPASSSSDEIEQWPHGGDAPPSDQPATVKVEGVEDFTAISPEEYRATVAKINAPDSGPTIIDMSKTPVDVPAATQQQVQTTQPKTHEPPAVPAAAQSSSRDTNSPMIVIPQAAHQVTIPTDPVRPTGPATPPGESLAARNDDSPTDATATPPTAAAWSTATVPGQTIQTISSKISNEPTQVGANAGGLATTNTNPVASVNPNASFAYQPGWTPVPAPVELPTSPPSPAASAVVPQATSAPQPVVSPAPLNYPPAAAYLPSVGGRYGQPMWLQSRGSSPSTGSSPISNPPVQPSALRDLATP
jgi:hypothetical protein